MEVRCSLREISSIICGTMTPVPRHSSHTLKRYKLTHDAATTQGLTDDADEDEYDAGDGGEDGGAAGVVDDAV